MLFVAGTLKVREMKIRDMKMRHQKGQVKMEKATH